MTREERFFDALRDIFVGVEIEGESGYVNLMKIKSSYYKNGVFPRLQEDINKALEPFPEFREELFDKLYTFFQRYFSETGSIYFNYTPIHQSVYEKIYTDDRDVILFWKTHMLYYVKTDRLFKDLEVEVDDYKFFFDVSTLEHKKANEKRDLIYRFKEVDSKGRIVFNVYYTERGTKTKVEEILRELKKLNIILSEETLESAFKVFEKQSEVDFFINKNAKEFLREQFNLWLYQYVFSGESEWTEKRIRQLQVLKDIAFKIIDFISQFEDELVKIWNKPKFVLNSNYVITLDRIFSKENGIDLIKKILSHPGIEEQIKEWKELGIVDDNFNKDKVLQKTVLGEELNPEYKFLPIDTRYFKDLELEILGLFDDLDNSLDGWLIKSENYQALNTILPKFKEKVQTIYIDPPFNKEQDADYFYNVKYKDSTWATLLENRLRLAKDLLNEKGSIFVRCDYNGNWIVRPLMNEIFGEENFLNDLILARITKKGFIANRYPTSNDYLFWYSKSFNYFFKPIRKFLKNKKEKWHSMDSMSGGRGTGEPRIILGELRYPPKGRVWSFSQERIYEMEKQGLIKLNSKGTPIYKVLSQEGEPLDSNWTDIPGYSFLTDFPTENSEILLKRVIESTSNQGDLVIDFFLGSGTTTAVAHKLGRKWLGVEMGEHFWTIVLPRMKKVLYYDKSGISKENDVKEKYNKDKAGGFFKYYELEQYEDTLRRVKYKDSEFFDNPYQDPYNQYIFMKDPKMLDALEIDYESNRVNVDLSKLYSNIDIAETLSNLLGKWIKKITPDYVEFEDGEKISIKDLDYRLIKPLIWW